MKKYYLLIGMMWFLLFMPLKGLFAQTTQLEINFNDGQTAFTPIQMNAGDPTFTLSVTDGVLNIQTNKKVNDWSFLGRFGLTLNLTSLPTVQFRIKSSANCNEFIVRVKALKKSNPAEQTQVEVKTQLTGGEDFKFVFADLTAAIAANPDYDITQIKEIHLDATNGWTNTFNGTVYLDYLKIGFPEPLPSGGTGYQELFDGAVLPAGAKANNAYSLSKVPGAMKVDVSRSTRWYSFDYELGGSYNLSAAPYLNLKVKANQDMVLQAFLVDENGKGYEVQQVGSQYKYDELVANKNEFRQARIYKAEAFNLAGFDFTGANPAIVDLSKIVKVKFVVNGTGLTFNGSFEVDELSLGDKAKRLANIGQIRDHVFMKNATGLQAILVPDVVNAEDLSLSGGSSLISDVTIAPISYTTVSENGISRTYGFSKISFNLVPDATGEETLTLSANGKAGFQSNQVEFKLKVTGNNPPTIDPLAALSLKLGTSATISLKNITDGDISAEQVITIEATSSNPAVTDNPTVDYTSPLSSGSMMVTAKAAGTSIIKVVVRDNGGSSPNDTVSVSFQLNSYLSLNQPPVVPAVANQLAINNEGQKTLVIGGITDGDNGTQVLSASAISSAPDIVTVDEVSIAGGTVSLKYTPQPGKIGNATITLTINDDGGDAENDGDKSTAIQFVISTKNPSALGYEWPNDKMDGLPTSGEYAFTPVTFDGAPAFKVDMTEKWTYAGVTFVFPVELDLTEIPVVQYEIYSVDIPTWHWNYFWDAFGYDGNVNRNIANSVEHQYQVPANQWTTLTFDYRDPGDLNNNVGSQIAIDRIHAFLLNMHGSKPTWPFTNTTGTLYIRNIRFGDKVQGLPAKTPVTTLNAIPNQVHYTGSGEHKVVLQGISNGNGSTDGVTVSTSVAGTHVVVSNQVGSLNPDGTLEFTYQVGSVTGNSTITVNIDAPGATRTTKTFRVTLVQPAGTQVATVNTDRTQKFQTIHGLGTFQHSSRHLDLYTTQLGASAMRLGIISNQWEPVNDNNDPNVLNMSGFNYDAFNWEWIRNLKERGVEIFILTSWSPPAWMKRNLSLDHKEQAIEWHLTDNILEPYYYEEFAESMEAIVRALKERSGVDLYAIGLQNEPAFNEPYPSAILSPAQFKELIKVVGKRFKDKGIQTKLYMPEQVTGIGFYSLDQYLDAIQADPVANQYVEIFACHGYGSDGITAGFPSFNEWNALWANAQEGTVKKEMWMTETHIGYSDFTSAMKLAGAIHGSLYAGNISLWTNWGFEDMQLTKNLPNSSFYTSMNYFKFIRPGAVRVKTESLHPDVMATAFENPDGTMALVMINKGTNALAVNLKGAGMPGKYEVFRTTEKENCTSMGVHIMSQGPVTLPSNSVTTLVGKLSSLMMDPVADVSLNKGDPQKTVEITGISNGTHGLSGVSLEANSTDPALTTGLTVSAINTSNGTATLSFTPASDKMGTAAIYLSLKDSEDNIVYRTFNVVIGNTSTEDNHSVDFRAYPNPVNDGSLNLETSVPGYERFTIRDLTGRIIYTGVIENNRTKVDVSGFSKGVYLVNFEGKDKTVTKRVVIQ